MTTDPDTLSNCPRTVATTKCLTEKWTPVWAESMVHVVLFSAVTADDIAISMGWGEPVLSTDWHYIT
jgi:hypothetical protein